MYLCEYLYLCGNAGGERVRLWPECSKERTVELLTSGVDNFVLLTSEIYLFGLAQYSLQTSLGQLVTIHTRAMFFNQSLNK